MLPFSKKIYVSMVVVCDVTHWLMSYVGIEAKLCLLDLYCAYDRLRPNSGPLIVRISPLLLSFPVSFNSLRHHYLPMIVKCHQASMVAFC